jgi:putative SOS response-associated peptidase YedK
VLFVCARTSLTRPTLADISDELEAEFSPEDAALYRPRWNVAPSDTTWIALHRGDARILGPAKWGYLASGKPLINVRGEQVASGSGFRDAFASRRCVLVADGFYEWNGRREPTWFQRVDGRLLLLGALFQPPPTKTEQFPRFTVLTTRPNATVAAVHDRMPVVLEPAALDRWLAGSPAEAAGLIVSAGADVLSSRAVSTHVNSVSNDDPRCIEPLVGERPGQRELF